MASRADLVVKNFNYHVGKITPTYSGFKDFTYIDPLKFADDFDHSSGFTRSFYTLWENSDSDQEPTDLSERVADHLFSLEVVYSSELKLEVLQDIILQDRHDIIKTLRNPDNFTGYSSDNPSDDVGLWDRVRVRDEVIRETENTWFLRQEWRCKILEGEI